MPFKISNKYFFFWYLQLVISAGISPVDFEIFLYAINKKLPWNARKKSKRLAFIKHFIRL